MDNNEKRSLPDVTIEDIREELAREKKRLSNLRWVNLAVLCVMVIAIIIAAVVPSSSTAVRITGDSMEPTLRVGDVVAFRSQETAERGDIIVFNYGAKLLVKRCIAVGGDVITVESDGSVIVNGEKIDEPYVDFAVLGQSDVTYPYTVPEGQYFVMGDHRAVSVDSRNSAMGCVTNEQLVGVVTKRIKPLDRAGKLD